MKCRANKDRSLTDAEDYAHELDLTFVFGNDVRVCSPNAAPSIELLGALVSPGELNHTWITRAGITEDVFHQLRQQKDGHALAQVCRVAIAQNDGVVRLSAGTILAVATESGKYGLLLVKEITPSSVEVDACHILL